MTDHADPRRYECNSCNPALNNGARPPLEPSSGTRGAVLAPVSVFVKSEQLMSSEQEKYETKVVGNGSSHCFFFLLFSPLMN